MSHPLLHPTVAAFKRGSQLSEDDKRFTLTDNDQRSINELKNHVGMSSFLKALKTRHGMLLRKWYNAPDDDFAQTIQLKARCSELDHVIRLLTDQPKPQEKKDAAGT